MSTSQSLTKREYDSRLLTVNVLGKLRRGDVVRTFDSVTAKFLDSTNAADLTVSVGAPSIERGTFLNFTCSGGTSGQSYLVVLRYTCGEEGPLESVVVVEVA